MIHLEQHEEISVTELKQKLDNKKNFILLDTREVQETEICALPFDLRMNLNEIFQNSHKLDKNKEYIIYCRSGVRSAWVLNFLKSKGFQNLKNLKGGILAWAEEIDKNMPVY